MPKPKPSASLAPFPKKKFLDFCKHLKILTRDFGVVPFDMLGSQSYIIDEICAAREQGIANIIVLKGRQIGASTLFTALDIFWPFQYPGMTGSIITHTEQLRDTFKNYIRIYLNNLPPEWKVPKEIDNRNMITFANASVMQFFVAGTKETSKGYLGTGSALNYLHKSEEAAYGNPEDLKNLQAALSTRNPHRLYISESTARGFNHFAETYKNALTSELTKVIFVGWWRNELFRYERGTMEFAAYWPENEKPNALERRRIKDVKEQFNFDIEPEQLAWYRATLNEAPYNGDQSKMDEEFPWTADHAFITTGSQFFTNNAITDQTRRARKGDTPQCFRYQMGYDWRDTVLLPSNERRADLKIWEEYQPLGRYIVSCDPAFGSSDQADRSAITVLRVYADRAVQVAEFASNMTSTHQTAWVLAHLCGYYSNCRMIMEIQGPGQAVDGELKKLKAELNSMFPREDKDLRNCLGGMKTFSYLRGDQYSGSAMKQFKTSREIKWRMMSHLKDAIELDRVIVNSTECLDECSKIVIDGGSIEAERGEHDDRVIALGMAVFAWAAPGGEAGILRSQGMTMERAAQLKADGKTVNVGHSLVLDYLRNNNLVKKPDPNVLPMFRPMPKIRGG